VRATADAEEVVSTGDEPYSVRLASKYVPVPSTAASHERRQYSRRRNRELDWVQTVRLRSAGEVSLIDLSAGGALIDSEVPLRPGALLSLEIIGHSAERLVVPLHVLRCHVAALAADKARYRGALEFTRPIELPDHHPLPELPGASTDPFVGVDSALKHLVERACAPDSSQRLASGDVMLVLQSLARRALNVGDPFGRHVGNLLQELLPALRHGHGLPAMLTAIERQLCQALPQARVRLVNGSPETPAGTKSVIISLPGKPATAEAVSIDLPSAAVITDAQARLLRTSSRLIALVQQLNGYTLGGTAATNGGQPATPSSPPPPAAVPARSVDPESPSAPGAWQKSVVRYADGQLLKGFTQDFHGSKQQFSLSPSINASTQERVVVPLARLKAVFFVREFAGNPDHIEQKVFEGPTAGRRIEVTLLDDEVLVGTTLNYRADSTGFFIFPADPRANNQRVFVVSSAVRQVRFP
jgi:hypothetical protein